MDERNFGEEESNQVEHFGQGQEGTGTVHIETGRGHSVEIPVGSDFRNTVERVANQANYGGYFRVYLNGEEVVNPADAPATIEVGMRIAITSYDKVG